MLGEKCVILHTMDDNTTKAKGRFAPSPTGRMHLGNVFSALLSWLSAKSQGGTWLLRIEDIDPQRSRQEFAELIRTTLNGWDWNGTKGRAQAETTAPTIKAGAETSTPATCTVLNRRGSSIPATAHEPT